MARPLRLAKWPRYTARRSDGLHSRTGVNFAEYGSNRYTKLKTTTRFQGFPFGNICLDSGQQFTLRMETVRRSRIWTSANGDFPQPVASWQSWVAASPADSGFSLSRYEPYLPASLRRNRTNRSNCSTSSGSIPSGEKCITSFRMILTMSKCLMNTVRSTFNPNLSHHSWRPSS